MNKQFARILLFMLLALMANALCYAGIEKDNVLSTIEKLGDGKFRVGKIIIDKANSRFRIEGKVLHLDAPLEFLAVTKGGSKGYESLIELDTNAFEFQLACILIGLDEKKGSASKMHFDPELAKGDIVSIKIGWSKDNRERIYPASETLVEGGKVVKDNKWAFTGSGFNRDGKFMSAIDGTLIGFVHDPSSIIEHIRGLGVGNYGMVGGNSNTIPKVGSAVWLEVEKVKFD